MFEDDDEDVSFGSEDSQLTTIHSILDDTQLRKQIDEKSQWISELLNPTVNIRSLAKGWKIRLNIWQRFWDRLFETQEYSKPRYRPGTGPKHPQRRDRKRNLNAELLDWMKGDENTPFASAPPVLMHFDGSLWERHEENKRIWSALGGQESYTAALSQMSGDSPNAQHIQQLATIISQDLAGVDVFWDGEVEDTPTGKTDGVFYRRTRPTTSKSKWGTLRVFHFPFTAIFRYDDKDCDDFVVLTALPVVNNIRRLPKAGIDQMAKFVRLNLLQETQVLRELRTRIRSLDDQHIRVEVTVPEGKEVKASLHMLHSDDKRVATGDVWTNPRTTEQVSVAPGFDFEVRTKKKDDEGAKCMGFLCGEPEQGVHPDNFANQHEDEEVKGRYDETKDQVLSREALGLANDYFNGADPILKRIASPKNVDQVYVQYVKKLYQTYRDALEEEHTWKRNILSYQFQYSVYVSDSITLPELMDELEKYETPTSPLLTDLKEGGKHRAKLEDLYKRLKEFDEHESVAFWYMFWHAIEMNNKAHSSSLIPPQVQRRLDPKEPGSRCAHELTQPVLVRQLTTHGLYHANGTGTITDSVLEEFYDRHRKLLRKKRPQRDADGWGDYKQKLRAQAKAEGRDVSESDPPNGVDVDDDVDGTTEPEPKHTETGRSALNQVRRTILREMSNPNLRSGASGNTGDQNDTAGTTGDTNGTDEDLDAQLLTTKDGPVDDRSATNKTSAAASATSAATKHWVRACECTVM